MELIVIVLFVYIYFDNCKQKCIYRSDKLVKVIWKYFFWFQMTLLTEFHYPSSESIFRFTTYFKMLKFHIFLKIIFCLLTTRSKCSINWAFTYSAFIQKIAIFFEFFRHLSCSLMHDQQLRKENRNKILTFYCLHQA